jgi:hypothetical protein
MDTTDDFCLAPLRGVTVRTFRNLHALWFRPPDRMKELWGYLHLSLRQGGRVWGSVKICRTVDEYRRVVEGVFDAFPGFAEDAALSGIE